MNAIKRHPMRAILAIWILAILTAVAASMFTGCGTTPAAKAAQAERVVILSVNDIMAEWRDYVNAGKATQAQIDNVRTAYNSYYAAQQVAKAVIEKMASNDPAVTRDEQLTAQQAVNDAESKVLAIVNQYLK